MTGWHRVLEVAAGLSLLATAALKMWAPNLDVLGLLAAGSECGVGIACLWGRWPRISGPLLVLLATGLLGGGAWVRGASPACRSCSCLGVLRVQQATLVLIGSAWLLVGGLLTLRPQAESDGSTKDK